MAPRSGCPGDDREGQSEGCFCFFFFYPPPLTVENVALTSPSLPLSLLSSSVNDATLLASDKASNHIYAAQGPVTDFSTYACCAAVGPNANF